MTFVKNRSYRKGKQSILKHFLNDFFEGVTLLLGFAAGVVFGYFVKLFGEIAFAVTVKLGFQPIFAQVFDNIFFSQFKIQIHKRHHQ